MSTKKPNKLLLVILIALFVSIGNYFCYPIICDLLSDTVSIAVAGRKLESGEVITKDDIKYVTVEKGEIDSSIYKNDSEIIGKVVSQNNTIYPNCCFYKQAIQDDIEPDETMYFLDIEVDKNYLSILSQYEWIDIYFQADDYKDSSMKITGLLVQNCQIEKILDSKAIVKLSVEDFDYCLRAKSIGKIVVVSTSNYLLNSSECYFSIMRTRMFIDEYSLAYRLM